MAAGALVALFDRGRRTWLANPHTHLAAPLLAWTAASVLATLAASDPVASAAKLRKLALFGMVFWPPAVVTRRWSIARLAMALLFGAGITSLYGLLTFFLQGGPQLDVRIRGFHGFYLTNAGLLLLCVFPALLFAGCRKLPSSSRWGAGLTAASVLGVLLFGRLPGPWLGCVAGLLFLSVVRRRRAGIVALGAALAVLLLAPSALREAARELSDPQSRTNLERAAIWRNGVELFRGDPWTGWGLHDLRDDYARVAGPGETLQGHMHSVPVNVAASMGHNR
jgi:O-antigen ligase